MRWWHDGAKIPPDQFLPLATELGAIAELDRHVLRVATRDMAALNRRFGADLGVAVNVAAEALDDTLAGSVAEALEASGLRPERLTIEITEQGALADLDRATATLDELRAMGVAVAVDDFGTGHSALAYLEHLPIDIVKIDRSFLPGDGEYGRGRELFGAIADLGCRLGFDVVAEGVETDAQLDLAVSSGCGVRAGIPAGPTWPDRRSRHLGRRCRTVRGLVGNSVDVADVADPGASVQRPVG